MSMQTPHEPEESEQGAPVEHELPVETAEQSAAYDSLIRSAHQEWAELEKSGDPSVSVSSGALAALKRSVRAEVRRGAQVAVPPTRRGPMSVSELTLHTVLRRAVDTVPDARSLRATVEYAEEGAASHGGRSGERGMPRAVTLRISVQLGSPGARDLMRLAEDVRGAAAAALHRDLGIDPDRIDVHIEDLHDQ
ncbi:hypothetical protein [Brachybacterium subflavum]|uniref:hypothetical protein n=1 Tax=Brachybacterium subflavum TaxID=2585206 RepID=UPI0012660F22|nr:hypothetical protein [Brachybacterium subflavum]